MRYLITLIFLFLVVLSSCSFNQEKQAKGIGFLQGKWAEDTVVDQNDLVTYQQHFITFTCDSFYLTIKTFSKVNLNGGPCYNAKYWQEYAKGYYQMIKDTLKLDGNFVDKAFRYKPEKDCYRFGKYQENFLLKKRLSKQITLRSLQTNLSHILNLKETLVCKVQKNN